MVSGARSANCVTLGRLLGLSEIPASSLDMEIKIGGLLVILLELSQTIYVNHRA
jgi:hypothetical protein